MGEPHDTIYLETAEVMVDELEKKGLALIIDKGEAIRKIALGVKTNCMKYHEWKMYDRAAEAMRADLRNKVNSLRELQGSGNVDTVNGGTNQSTSTPSPKEPTDR